MQSGTVSGLLTLSEILKTQTRLSGGILCRLGSHTYVLGSWMCKKQTPVTRSSTASEITSVDIGLRMDGIPALNLWNLVVEVLHYSTNQVQKPSASAERPAAYQNI